MAVNRIISLSSINKMEPIQRVLHLHLRQKTLYRLNDRGRCVVHRGHPLSVRLPGERGIQTKKRVQKDLESQVCQCGHNVSWNRCNETIVGDFTNSPSIADGVGVMKYGFS